MRVKIWGARGSIPSPLPPDAVREKIYQALLNLPADVDPRDPAAARRYVDSLSPLMGGTAGGNTPCIEIQAGQETFIIDAGSGIRSLGLELMNGPCGRGTGVLHIFFSHAHWDHIQGFPFFRPAFVPGNRIFIYSVHAHPWQNVLEGQQQPINFPVPVDYMQASMEFVQLQPDQPLSIGPVNISTIKNVHPGDAYAFRFEADQSVFVYASDAEYKQSSEASLRPHLDFFKDADVLIFDSQLTLKEVTIEKEDWGHSSALIGVDLAQRADVKKLVLFHHDPTDSDADLLRVQAEAMEYQDQDTLHSRCEVIVGYEGLTFDLIPTSAVMLHHIAEDDVAVLTLTRIFDEQRVDDFEQQLALLAKTGWPSRLVIDLSQVEALAVIGLRPLVALRRTHPETLVALAGLSERVRRVIKLAGFLDYFTIYPTVTQALLKLGSGKGPDQTGPENVHVEGVDGSARPDEAKTTGMFGRSRQHLRPLVGRQKALQTILTCWDKVQAGQGQLVFIAGETGIGKTRLSQEMESFIEAGTLLVGHCYALEGSLAYQPFIEAFQTYFATVPPDLAYEKVGQFLGNLAHLIPEARALMSDLPHAPPLESKQEQLRLMSSLAQYIEWATQENPWLIILDDIHWADQSSLQVLHYLARHCTEIPLLIIGTYRDTDLEDDQALLETLHDLQRSPGFRLIELDRLNQAEVGQMLTDIWDDTVPPTLISKIYECTEGNPFYVEEVAKGLVDEGVVEHREERWHFSVSAEIRLPQSVRDAVLGRIGHLNRHTQSLLRRAAVLGRTFNFEDLREMTDLSEWTLLEHLDVALERQLLEEAADESTLQFRHAEIQTVLYDDLSVLRRRLLHRQAGEALERRYLSDPKHRAEELANHFNQAGETEKAVIYSIQAARYADDAYASQTALMWYDRALELLDQLGLADSTLLQKCDLLLAREHIYNRQGMRDKQAADLSLIQEIADILDDPTKQAQVHNRQAYYHRLISNYTLAHEHAQIALEAASLIQDPVLEGESLINLAYASQEQGHFQQARQYLERAQTILEKTADRRMEAIALNGLGNLNIYLNNYDQAHTYYEQALAMNRSLHNRRGESTCLNNMGELARNRGHYSEARSYYNQSLDISQTIGDRQVEALARNNLSLTYFAWGSYEEAQLYIEEALPIYASIEMQGGVAECLRVMSAIHHALSEYQPARDKALQALDIFEELARQAKIAETQMALGLALEGLGETEEAYEVYNQSLNLQLEAGNKAGALDARAGLARCLLARDKLTDALAQIELSRAQLSEHGLSGVDYPSYFYLTAYRVLKESGDSEAAAQILNDGYTLLQGRAAQIADEILRQSFLENVAQNRDIIEEWAAI